MVPFLRSYHIIINFAIYAWVCKESTNSIVWYGMHIYIANLHGYKIFGIFGPIHRNSNISTRKKKSGHLKREVIKLVSRPAVITKQLDLSLCDSTRGGAVSRITKLRPHYQKLIHVCDQNYEKQAYGENTMHVFSTSGRGN